jgi:glycosyltransferase involved in cell wall biosynthesis
MAAECLVVDASDGQLDSARDANQWTTWIPYAAPVGVRFTIAHQRNVGVRASLGRVVAFCDAGGQPHPDWLERLVSPVLNGRCLAATGPIIPTGAGAYGELNEFADGSWVTHVITANFALAKEAFDLVSGFDERYAYGSDAVLGWRLDDEGIGVLTVGGAVMSIDWGDAARERVRAWRQGRAWGRQLRLYKGRRLRILRAAPFTIMYWTVFAGAVPLSMLTWATGTPWPLAVWAAAVALLIWSARPRGARGRVVSYHLIHGVAAFVELAASLVARAPNTVGSVTT